MKGSRTRPLWTLCRRVYLVWGVILLVGFLATHFHQEPNINILWLLLSLVGLGYMVRQTSLPEFRRHSGLAHLYYVGFVWVLVIALGMLVSVVPFVGRTPLNGLAQYLGIFWLAQMGLGHGLNGLVDPPRWPYWVTASGQVLAALVCLGWGMDYQYLVAGGVGSLAMVVLACLHPGY